MSTVNISLPDKLRADADRQIQAGYYISFSDLVRTAIRRLLPTDQLLLSKKTVFDVLDKEKIVDFCRKNGIKSLKLFGSLARGEAKPGSDVDLLVEFEKNRVPGLFGLIEMEDELSQKFHRPVELITKLNKHVEPYANQDMITLYEKR